MAANASLPSSLNEAVSRFGTPCYVYYEQRILDNIKRFRSVGYPHCSLYFASMANDNPHLLDLLRRHGVGVFVNSMKHLRAALSAGFSGSQLIYAATGLTAHQMTLLNAQGIKVHLDSLEQVATFATVLPERSLGVRLNIEDRSRGGFLPAEASRIGITEAELPELLRTAASRKLRLTGTHAYLGTNIPSADLMLKGVERALSLSSRFPDLEYVDLGGGFPAVLDPSSAFDFNRYNVEVSALFTEFSRRQGRPIRMVLEPGRALLADAAFFCASLVDVRERPDRIIATCDASVSLFPRPLINGEFHPARWLESRQGEDGGKPVDIAGSTTYSNDYLARNVQLPKPHSGDVVVFELAGSYCFSMMSRFLGQAWPCEALFRADGTLTEIRCRENVALEAMSLHG